jgi:hypothetical protein
MREKGTAEEITFDPEIERTLLAKLRAKRLAETSTLKVKETLTDESMAEGQNPPPPLRRTMGDYCRRTDTEQVSLGFRPAKPASVDIKSNVLVGLRESQFDGRANNDPWEHLTKFSKTCQLQRVPEYVTEDQKKLRMFWFFTHRSR